MTKHHFTLIAYRENCDEVIRGQVMSSTNSDYRLVHTDDVDDAIETVARWRCENLVRNRYNTSELEVAILVDGYDDEDFNEERGEVRYGINEKACELARTYEHIHKERSAEGKRQAELKKQEQQTAYEKEQLRTLQEKYGEV